MIRFIGSKGKLKGSKANELLAVPCLRILNILAHAQMEELDLGSVCGGHGVCGGDRIQVPMDAALKLSPVTDREREHLSEAELLEGWRLGCQCWPENDDLDVSISVPLKFTF